MSLAPKRLYLARRKLPLTREQFRDRWRIHARLAMEFMARQNWENVTGYTHFDPLPEACGIADASDSYDAIGCIRFKDADARRRHIAFAEARAALEVDEEEFFAERVNKTGMVTWESVLRDGPSSGVTKFCFLKRKREMSPKEFEDAWKKHAALLLQAAPSMHRYVQNHPLKPENGNAWGLDRDGVEESWYASLGELEEAEDAPAMRTAVQGRDCFASDCIVVIARPAVLYSSQSVCTSSGRGVT